MKAKNVRAILALIMASVVWGASFVVTKDTLDYMSPMWQLALRLDIALIPAIILAIINLKKWNKQLVIKSMILGTIFFTAVMVQNLGMKTTSASKSSFLTGTYVAFIPFIEYIVLRRKAKIRRIIAAVICLIGTGLMTIKNGFKLEPGDILLLGCGLAYAVHILYIEHCDNENPFFLHLGQIITASLLATIAALIFDHGNFYVNARCVPGLMYCGIFEVFIGFLCQLVGQRNTNAALAGIIMSLESLFGAVFAVIFLHDIMSVPMIIGGALIIGAAMINGL